MAKGNFYTMLVGMQISVATIEQYVKVKVTQSCPTLCDPMDYTVHGILQARLLEWVTIPFSRGSSNQGISNPDSVPYQLC